MKISFIITVFTWFVGIIGIQVHAILLLTSQGVSHWNAFWSTVPLSFVLVGCGVFHRIYQLKKTPTVVLT